VKVTLESTTEIIAVLGRPGGDVIQCRVWEGVTECGVKVQALIPRIAAHKDSDVSQFESELQEQRAPSADFEPWPLRMIL
jgi:hypothetical protein